MECKPFSFIWTASESNRNWWVAMRVHLRHSNPMRTKKKKHTQQQHSANREEKKKKKETVRFACNYVHVREWYN